MRERLKIFVICNVLQGELNNRRINNCLFYMYGLKHFWVSDNEVGVKWRDGDHPEVDYFLITEHPELFWALSLTEMCHPCGINFYLLN